MSKTKGRSVPAPDEREPGVYTTNLYGYHADMPLVELEIHGYPEPRVQMTVDQARRVALQILETCEAAMGDAFVVRFFRERVGIEQRQVAGLLNEFRAMRESLKRPSGEAPPSA